MKRLLLILLLGALESVAIGKVQADFDCNIASNNVPYCRYTGAVQMAYARDDGVLLMYIPQSFDKSLATAVGILGVTKSNAFSYRIQQQNPNSVEFARTLYATLLTAQAQGRDVMVQMRKVVSGYLIIDRIWLY